MKVLILHNDLRVYWKGRIKYLRGFLAEHGIKLSSIELFGKGSPYAFDPFDSDNCLFPDNSYEELTKAEIKTKLFKKLDEIDPDVIIGGSIVFFSGALGLRWSKKHNKKFVMFDDGKPSDIKRNVLTQFIKDTITSQVDALWLPSEDYDKEYDGLFRAPTLLFHGYNTIDNQLFKIDGEKQFNHNSIICVARLVHIKNMERLFKAWKIVEANDEIYKLVIIGTGPELDTLTKLMSDLELKRIEFAGLIHNNEIPTYLFNSDAFVLASLSESWGLVVNEAMAAGLPILLSNKINAAIPLLHEGINGFKFDPYNVEEMADKIMKFISLDISSKKNMSVQSLVIINEMDYGNMGNKLLNALPSIVSQNTKKPGLLAGIFINFWDGSYNTTGWNK